ncbi:hypothetical protein L249_4975 [Ophiocordyceps polyrhachis-furcata BCC 54312]|uniref:Pantoate--beta-alanine ligase n=1 Tax=Ophiocordyceps polyrhachis-furcata BCC 54312 TaxID=1330021 RepID=A0A367L3Q3_9HYPO|nr:hypothetical protein L249_4975 [Ophiocordyceps polyrhachis-furcata BCC 54312]
MLRRLGRPVMTLTRTPTTARRSLQTETLPSTSIPIIRTIEAMRTWRALRTSTVGLVPTMGALHEGHLSLIRAAARQSSDVVVSVFLNPAQFGAREDLASYPVTWDDDAAALARIDGQELASSSSSPSDGEKPAGRIRAVFAPDVSTMYPEGAPGPYPDSKGSFVSITPLGEVLEGASRPTFFRGVATVCIKLFNLVQPDLVFLGQKDVQQTVVLRRMVRDLMLPTRIVVCPTARDDDGLALSSRNVYLGPRRRAVAVRLLPAALAAASAAYGRSILSRADILRPALEVVSTLAAEQRGLSPEERATFELDYMSLADPDTLLELDAVDPLRGAVLSAAVRMLPLEKVRRGEEVGYANGPLVRLIDNVILEPPKVVG